MSGEPPVELVEPPIQLFDPPRLKVESIPRQICPKNRRFARRRAAAGHANDWEKWRRQSHADPSAPRLSVEHQPSAARP